MSGAFPPLTEQGAPVIFDATANRRPYRDRARQQIRQFLEVCVDCPLPTCMARDRKGIDQQARGNAAANEARARKPQPARVVALLVEKGYIQ